MGDSAGADPALLDGYLEILASVCYEGRRVARNELDSRRAAGIAAAERNVSLGNVVDLYLSATWVAWRHLPRPPGADTEDVATVVLRATNDAVVALADGYESAQRMAIRFEEATRRDFIDDLLNGVTDTTRLPERAARFGLQLAGSHSVAVARADVPFADGDELARRVESALRGRFGTHSLLIATKDGQLVCAAPGTLPDAASEFARHARTSCGQHAPGLQVGIGRPHEGPAGVAHSYQEAVDVLDLARRLELDTPVLRAVDLLVFQVLFRDRAAITDLVATVLGPLESSRCGAQPLVDTLAAYFDTGNSVAAAHRLSVGVRTVSYRLRRIRQLTGHSHADPAQRFTLQAAVLGARLLRWPAEPINRPPQRRSDYGR